MDLITLYPLCRVARCFNFYIEIQNFLAQENPRPDEYTLARTDEGVLISPQELVKIEREERNTPFPSFGFVFDF